MHAKTATRWQDDEGRDSASPGPSHKRGSFRGPASSRPVVAFPRRDHDNVMIGSLIGEHIRILGVLGQGGMGEVYAGIDERLGRKVAVKAIRADRREGARERFLREARALSSLDHPNICRIFEYIESPEGAFLVLELIDGVTLQRAIERGMSRPRKLQAASEILAALIAAHKKGIVHRDLKPDNVMITPEGTTKVLDFGIAHLEAFDDEESIANGASEERVEDDATLIYPIAGAPAPRRRSRSIIAGTPLYMSPEQAVGGDITTASDLYSFGLLLQTLFTEKPPQDVVVSREVMRQLAARGESLPMTGQPRDLTALVVTLKDMTPANRPTAAEARATIQRIIDTPKRRIRMAVTALAIVLLLGGAAKYAFDVTTARNEAQQQRGQAEELVRFMVGDLRRKLEPIGRLDVLDGAASRALAYFASLSPEEMTGGNLNDDALALAQLGQARDKEGKLPQAIELFRQSVRFGTAAVNRDPAHEEWQLTLSNAYFWLGDALRRKGDVRGTLQNFQSYFAISQRLAQRHPNDPKYQAEVSYAHGNIGAAYELAGDLPRALAEYRVAAALDRDRLRHAPDDEQWQADFANSSNRLGVVLQNRGDFTGARSAFDDDLRMRRRLLQNAPDDVRRKRRLAVSLAYAGTLHQATGDTAQALTCYREETVLTARLAADDPSNADARRNHAVAEARLASVTDPAEGLPLAEAASKDLRALVRADARSTWRRDLAAALSRLTTIRLRLGDLPGARSTSGDALLLSEALVAERPKDATCIRILCESLVTAAAIDQREGRLPLALQRRIRAAAVASNAVQDPSVAAARVRALLALGRQDEAAPLAQRLLAGGYREAEFVALTAAVASPHSPPDRSLP
jgi:tetratricopeptide (TPR) repeat protein